MGSSTGLVGRSVLIVENEPLIALELKELFEAEGANVHVASTVTDASRLIKQTTLSAAVLDFSLIGGDTAQICRTLRAYSVPFMYYTGLDGLDEKSLAAPILIKPASAVALITTIKELLNLSTDPP